MNSELVTKDSIRGINLQPKGKEIVHNVIEEESSYNETLIISRSWERP